MPINSKPHKRVLLMQPTVAPAPNGNGYSNGGGGVVAAPPAPGGATVAVPPIPADPYAAVGNAAGETGRPVRIVAYLAQDESEQLDQLWLKMRGYGVRPSKADLMRVALLYAVSNPEAVADLVRASEEAEASAAAMNSRAASRRR